MKNTIKTIKENNHVFKMYYNNTYDGLPITVQEINSVSNEVINNLHCANLEKANKYFNEMVLGNY